jgi:hypothetical protein
MSIIGFPLLLIPVAICNIIVFLMPGLGFDAALARVALPSGTTWTIALGDVLVALGVLLLLPEVIKAARPGARYLTDHLLSLLVLGGTLAEFVMLPQFGNATMALLAALALVDFLAGIALRSRRQQAARAPQPAPRSGKLRGKAAAAAHEAPPAAEATPAPVEPVSASAAAASIAEAVLLDRPEPVTATATIEAKSAEKAPAR